METLLKDVRFGVRMLVKNPGFFAVAALTLALGIGATTAIFSVVNAVLLRPLPWHEPDRLVWIWGTNPINNIPQETASMPDFLDWKAQNTVFESMAGFIRQQPAVATDSGSELLAENIVTPDYFSVLAVSPALGRGFTAEDAVDGKNRVAVISHALWQRRFGGDPGVLEKSIKIQGRPHDIIGVLPQEFVSLRTQERAPTEVWRPLVVNQNMSRRSDFLGVIARLKPGVAIAQAQAELDTIAARLADQYPDTNRYWGVIVLPLHDRLVGTARPALTILLGAVGFLLLLVCANVANLLLARASGRGKEIAIRTALGAARGRLVRQLLTESALLALVGGGVGVLLATWGLEILGRLGPPEVHGIDVVQLDGKVLGFALAIALGTGLIFGILPALLSATAAPGESLKEGGRGGGGAGVAGRRLRDMLVIAEVAVALLLLVGAALMIRSLVRLQSIDPGFRTEGFLTASLNLPRVTYPDDHQIRGFYDNLLDRLAALPGVTGVAGARDLPHDIGSYLAFSVEGRPPLPDGIVPDATWTYATPGYFETLGIPLVRGRFLDATDAAPPATDGEPDPNAPQAPMAAVVNASFVKKFFPDEDPLGHRITLSDPVKGPWMTIVGIVGDTRNAGLDKETYPAIYQAYSQVTSPRLVLLLKTEGDAMAHVPAVRAAVRDLDKDLPVAAMMTLTDHLAGTLAPRRFNMLLLTLFAVVALVLAAVGIYGVISYGVARRVHEIGVRMALGAQPGDVIRLIARQGLGLTLAGVAAGLLLAFALTRLLSSLLFDVSATDPLAFAITAAILGLVAVPATWIPARRATRVDPLSALRLE